MTKTKQSPKAKPSFGYALLNYRLKKSACNRVVYKFPKTNVPITKKYINKSREMLLAKLELSAAITPYSHNVPPQLLEEMKLKGRLELQKRVAENLETLAAMERNCRDEAKKGKKVFMDLSV